MTDIHDQSLLNQSDIQWINPATNKDTINQLNESAGVYGFNDLTDYGRSKMAKDPFWLFQPTSIEQAILGLSQAAKLGINVRVRGAGHSMNGRSLPKFEEMLFSTLGLNHLQSITHKIIEVGSGAQIWEVDRILRHYGCSLPVINDGDGPAPTAGGFFSAGGFGVHSKFVGGFWNHVDSIKIWNPQYGVKTIQSNQQEFWNYAAAGGALNSVILSMRLLVEGELYSPINQKVPLRKYEHPRLLWFTFIAPTSLSRSLIREIAILNNALKTSWKQLPPYAYLIRSQGTHKAFHFHPTADSDLITAGVWGHIEKITNAEIDAMLLKVNQMQLAMPNIKRYWQSEL